jgi:hypothetical protein
MAALMTFPAQRPDRAGDEAGPVTVVFDDVVYDLGEDWDATSF